MTAGEFRLWIKIRWLELNARSRANYLGDPLGPIMTWVDWRTRA